MKSWAMIGVLAVAGLAYGEGVTVKPIATQPAAKPATESVEQMQARLKRLKEEVSALELKIAAASPKPNVAMPYVDPAFLKKLETLPKELWPSSTDKDSKARLRKKWFRDQFGGDHTTYAFAGKMLNEQEVEEGVMYVVIECQPQRVWGMEFKGFRVAGNVAVDLIKTLEWNKDTGMVLTGSLAGNDLAISTLMDETENQVGVMLLGGAKFEIVRAETQPTTNPTK